MNNLGRWVGIIFLLAATAAWALDLSDLTNKDAVAGLKQALTDGAGVAVKQLGAKDGFFGNPQVKIPLPASLQKVESMLKMVGMQQQVDDLDLAMNRAAESAVADAKPLLVNAVKQMTVEDAKNILSGGDTAATDYFRSKTADPLAKKFLPTVQKATAKVGLAAKYNAVAGQAAQFGLVDKNQATIEQYVTDKALDGLYTMIGEQEKAIRANPAAAATGIVKKVFGALQ
ncbi:MAG TPA: DUF4197 domain-containing protein [Burkholderiales bacterium]|nr:DUF4197 domain-containing protein [Burkholderiales bacterium]